MRLHQYNTRTSRGLVIIIVIAILSMLIMVSPIKVCAKDVVTSSNNSVTLKAKRFNKINIKLTWSKPCKAYKYVVYKKSPHHKYKRIKTTKHSYCINKKVFKHHYAYKIKAYLKGGKTIISNTVIVHSRIKRTFHVKAYAYHCGSYCANGQRCKVGRIATDPSVIPTGTWLYVNGYGLAKACDTGGDIDGRTVDLYMASDRACDNWGIRYPMVYILK